MSFSKAEQLLQLASMITARRHGMSLDEVRENFNISHRTAQRMMRALEVQFPDVEIINDNEGRRRWKLNNSGLRDFLSVSAEELAALELAANHLERAGLTPELKSLRVLQDKILSLIPRSKSRLEPDADAILEAQGPARVRASMTRSTPIWSRPLRPAAWWRSATGRISHQTSGRTALLPSVSCRAIGAIWLRRIHAAAAERSLKHIGSTMC